MIVEMIAAEVGEAAGRDAHAVEPMLVEPVRGGLDREMRDAFAGELIQRAVQRDRIGRGERAVDLARCGATSPTVPMLAAVMPSADQIWRVKAATEVFPLVPVTAAMVGWRGKNFAAASASARRTSLTLMNAISPAAAAAAHVRP